MNRLSLFFASDIHGSEILWRKFINAGSFYDVDVLLMGGDMCGKAIVPIIENTDGTSEVTFMGRHLTLSTAEQLKSFEEDVRFNGMYPYHCAPEEYSAMSASTELKDKIFNDLMEQTFAHWLEIAEQKLSTSAVRCLVMPGNDDPYEIDRTFRPDGKVQNCDEKVIDLGNGYTLLSVGSSNPTPWHTPRELSEEELTRRIDALAPQIPDMKRAIFNLHVPPYNSQLDLAPDLNPDLSLRRDGGGEVMVPVGSTAVRKAIEQYQPLLSLHGHIHESRGARNIGSTVCMNPGSSYNTGRIDSVLVYLEKDHIKRHQFLVG